MKKNEMKKIKFVVFYDTEQNINENRSYPLSSAAVVDYIISVLNRNNIAVEIVSPATTRNVGKWYCSKQMEIGQKITLTLGPTLCLNNTIVNKVLVCLTRIWICMYLIKNTKQGDIVFVWHQIPLMRIIQTFRWFTSPKKLKFIFSVGELYQYVIPRQLSRIRKRLELNLLNSADGYILSTHLLNRYLDISSKPQCVLHGSMMPCKKNMTYIERFTDNKIHILYSGIINGTKGAFLAVDVAHYLTDQYCIHILGWPAEYSYIQKLQLAIENSNKSCSCTVEYNGVLRGEDYHNFVRKCHIGLCTQDVDTAYNDCSFPSKIMTYICDDLIVISTKIEAVVESNIKDAIYFVNSNSPKDFANVIKSVDISNRRTCISLALHKLSDKFEHELLSMIEQIEAAK